MDDVIGIEQRHPTQYWHALDDGRIQCDVCPHDCKLDEGQRGACFVRGRVDNQVVLATYGRASGFCVDPIEKMMLNHFLPGSSVFSLGTAGCNLACCFCPSGDISRARAIDHLADSAAPEPIAQTALAHGSRSVAFTYNDPVVYLEYALDTADACHALKLKTVAITAGYVHAAPRREFYAKMDAANVGLKAFSEDFYTRFCDGHLQPVLDTLAYIHHDTDCWLEVSVLLIPGHNDSDAELGGLAKWMARELGPGVPLHFSTFHPDWHMTEVPQTPTATLGRARRIALDAGLHYVYTGNVHDVESSTTYCPACRHALIVRDWYDIRHYELTSSGRCIKCGATIAGHFGRFGKFGKLFGRKRIPIHTRLQA